MFLMSKGLIDYTNCIIENIISINWILGVGGTSFKAGTVTVPHSVKFNIMDWLPNVSYSK